MRVYSFVAVGLLLLWVGCARVRVEAPKEPIKVDISMRLDIYQHVQNDLNDIENMVSGKDKHSLLEYITATAYAQEGFSSEVEQAAGRRKDRKAEIVSWESKKVIGENRMGLLEVRDAASADAGVNSLVSKENSDRMVIYRAVAAKNGVAVDQVQKMHAKRLQSDAPAGTPIEVLDASGGQYQWKSR
ncbi:MAG TPA: DUF1318 domain-containing protein [Patescibacteria group bacterium]|nr:DUF1318 domain-containing protein [Patescibacteria group bacterium]